MTELNDTHHPKAAQPTPEWPHAAAVDVGDPAVMAVLLPLDGLESLPVAGHEAVYSELHDGLLAALNEDAPAGSGGV